MREKILKRMIPSKRSRSYFQLSANWD